MKTSLINIGQELLKSKGQIGDKNSDVLIHLPLFWFEKIDSEFRNHKLFADKKMKDISEINEWSIFTEGPDNVNAICFTKSLLDETNEITKDFFDKIYEKL